MHEAKPLEPISDLNVESELSYAYLHAVASHAGASCSVSNRHEDNAGVDAKITAWGPFPSGGYRHEVDLKVQLKATITEPVESKGCLSYSFSGIKQYDDLRSDTVATPRILVVLFLPKSKREWLIHTEDKLSLSKCAYWVSLRDAPASKNETSQTIYLPKAQKFDVANLADICDQIASGQKLKYAGKPT
ncbi:DUF4365 domain-containing protein [Phaeobacter inhibens]|uniref:DUF4365 domain-containing protein n=1 Tax=Phaeobacter inhibens TaxID=221822 RepID=UPI0021A5E586|nr:DUF4365 domain-containing protein [Phaeobacter inhibens]UWR47117.1 DUF4365 domain-containing protein [Phaeobacter inhibens]